ncbi:hypothetical protein ABBQ38_006434 [Trebouxia sp. C0009 RCD-2024]
MGLCVMRLKKAYYLSAYDNTATAMRFAGCTEYFGSWPNNSAAYSKEQKNNLVKMVNEFINRHMVSKGFYPSMPDSQACVLHVLGKENLPAAKQYLKELAIIEMVRPRMQLASIKSSITKRVKAEIEKQGTVMASCTYGEEKDSVVLDNDFAECMLTDDNYMTNRQAEANHGIQQLQVQSLTKGEQNLPQQGEPAESVKQHY